MKSGIFALELLLVLGGLLFGTELVSKTGGVNHGLLRLIFGVLGFVQHVIKIGMKSGIFALELPLGDGEGGVGGSVLAEGFVGIGEFRLGSAAAAVGLFEQGASLLQFTVNGVGLTLRGSELFAVLGGELLFVFKLDLHILVFSLGLLDHLLDITVDLVGGIECNLELTDVSLELLLQAENLSLALGFGFKGGLHVLNSTGVSLAGGFEFFFLLLDTLVDLLLNLAEFKLSAQDLGLFLFKGSFSFLKGGLQFFLLDFVLLRSLLDLGEGAATFADLFHEVLDLLGETLVFTADGIEVLEVLLVHSLDTEVLGRELPAFLLGNIKISSKAINLDLVVVNGLVEELLLLLGIGSHDLGTLEIKLHSLNVNEDGALLLIEGEVLQVQLFDLEFSFLKTGIDLQAGSLNLFGLHDTFLFVLGTPHHGISISLVVLALSVSLGFDFLVVLFAEAIEIVLEVAVLAEQSTTLLALVFNSLLDFLKLAPQGLLQLVQLAVVGLALFILAKVFGVLNGKLLLLGIEVVEGTEGFVVLGLELNGLVDDSLVGLLCGGLISGKGIHSRLGLFSISLKKVLLLLNLSLHLSEVVNLVGHFSNSIVVLLAKSSKSIFMVDLALFVFTADLGVFGIALLAELQLGIGGTTGLLKALIQIVQFLSNHFLGLLGLGASLALKLNLRLKLFNLGLHFLGLLGLGAGLALKLNLRL